MHQIANDVWVARNMYYCVYANIACDVVEYLTYRSGTSILRFWFNKSQEDFIHYWRNRLLTLGHAASCHVLGRFNIRSFSHSSGLEQATITMVTHVR